MLSLADPAWEKLPGGYRTPYDASVRLRELEAGSEDLEEIWEELWSELHHQGSVDLASYATVPQLVRICIARKLLDWNVFAIVSIIEECRVFGENPEIPDDLADDYKSAIWKLAEFGSQNFSTEWEPQLTQTYLAVAAFAKGSLNTARLLSGFSDEEMKEVYEKFYS